MYLYNRNFNRINVERLLYSYLIVSYVQQMKFAFHTTVLRGFIIYLCKFSIEKYIIT